MAETVLKVEGLTKHYGPFVAVNAIDFEIKKGEVVGLLGPNGAGKSSTIQMLLGLLTPSSGSVKYFNKDNAEVWMPDLIGCGLANGNREQVLEIIEKILKEQTVKIFADLTKQINDLIINLLFHANKPTLQ